MLLLFGGLVLLEDLGWPDEALLPDALSLNARVASGLKVRRDRLPSARDRGGGDVSLSETGLDPWKVTNFAFLRGGVSASAIALSSSEC